MKVDGHKKVNGPRDHLIVRLGDRMKLLFENGRF